MKKNILLLLSIISINLISQINQNSSNLLLFNESNNYAIEFANKQKIENGINLKNKNPETSKISSLLQQMDSIRRWELNLSSNQFSTNKYRYFNYLYDANNNQTSYTRETWNGTTWIGGVKFLNTYDANSNQISSSVQSWNSATLTWVNSGNSYTYTYDTYSNLISMLIQSWNSTTLSWVNSSKYTSTFDANNNQTSYLRETWNDPNWVITGKNIYTYDASNNQTSDLNQTWNGTTYVNSTKYTNTYNANNNQISSLIQVWNSTTLTWVNDNQKTYIYDANSNQTSYLWQIWNGTTWTDANKYTYTYDANNNQTSCLFQIWNNTTMVNNYLEARTYDVNNKVTTYLRQNWNGTTWVINSLYNYTFDVNAFQMKQVFYSYNSGVLASADSIYYYYRTFVGINELQAKEKFISIYPNPSKEIFNLKTDKDITFIEVYNNIGILVSNPELKSNNQIDLSSLSKGIYFIKIFAGKQNYTEKVIIE
jgi:hypothetical protein